MSSLPDEIDIPSIGDHQDLTSYGETERSSNEPDRALSPEDIERKEFLMSLRGYDKDGVNAFLRQVAAHYREALAAAEGVSVDPLSDLGTEVADILEAAKRSAEARVAEAEREAAEIRERTMAEMAELRARVERETVARSHNARSLATAAPASGPSPLGDLPGPVGAPLDHGVASTDEQTRTEAAEIRRRALAEAAEIKAEAERHAAELRESAERGALETLRDSARRVKLLKKTELEMRDHFDAVAAILDGTRHQIMQWDAPSPPPGALEPPSAGDSQGYRTK